ncbi:hypothetical protein [Phaeovulum vinaykumarii]|uniref:Uncharacterized protein n=1 Tax=Phaeovulum vinaykumarii TaxID=407234 RepID=A0A1N7JRM5_9RHOB|nr:hypothetical protein [Phaeovulum vinaykumarii]SIS51957.1 hypothetical protein SAMN05421795_101271 [Phaeovulum vinaykumarii]SOB91021.1 hypothetical protein SAMN05878426_101271 [Phaeovulum vinaykumarii]
MTRNGISIGTGGRAAIAAPAGRAVLAGLLALGALPGGAVAQASGVHSQSLAAQGHRPALRRHLRMAEGATGAQVAYFNDVMTGGMECPPGATGDEGCLHWDGLASYFEVTLEGVTETDAIELKKGVVAAVLAVCPTANAPVPAPAGVEVIGAHLYRIAAACPPIDARGM